MRVLYPEQRKGAEGVFTKFYLLRNVKRCLILTFILALELLVTAAVYYAHIGQMAAGVVRISEWMVYGTAGLAVVMIIASSLLLRRNLDELKLNGFNLHEALRIIAVIKDLPDSYYVVPDVNLTGGRYDRVTTLVVGPTGVFAVFPNAAFEKESIAGKRELKRLKLNPSEYLDYCRNRGIARVQAAVNEVDNSLVVQPLMAATCGPRTFRKFFGKNWRKEIGAGEEAEVERAKIEQAKIEQTEQAAQGLQVSLSAAAAPALPAPEIEVKVMATPDELRKHITAEREHPMSHEEVTNLLERLLGEDFDLWLSFDDFLDEHEEVLDVMG